jgi:hypothetical protein
MQGMRTPTGWARRAALAASIAAFAALLAPPASGTAHAQQAGATDQARQHFARGKQLFATGDYRGAIAEFAAADKIAPSPLLEFNIALCHERLGERAEAVRRYRLYLERVPAATNRKVVEDKIARLEAEIASEAQSKKAAPQLVPPPVGGETLPPPADAKPPAAAPPSTGDPELDRAARIDIGKLRARRRAASDAPPRSAGSPPRSAGAPPTAPPPRKSEPAPPPPAPRDEGEKKSKPIYKQWWFWVIAGVSAIVIINIATADSDPDDGRARILPESNASTSAAQPGGAVLLRF